jgi:hypothetical protein
MCFPSTMRKHVVLLSLVLGSFGLGGFLACGSSSSGSGSSTDGGHDSSIPGTDSGGGVDSGGGTDSGGTDTGGGTTDSPTEGDSGDAGPQVVTLEFDPNGTDSPVGIHWDNTNQVLYIVDNSNNQVWTWTDANGFKVFATVPDNPALDDAGHTKLNGVTELSDGTLVVVRFGFGVGGAIYTVSPDGGSATVPNVPVAEKRLEATFDPTVGTIYSSAFSGGGGSPAAGKVEIVNLTTGTTQYASGFGKTVGILVQGSTLFVSDQTNGVILAVPTDGTQLADGGAGLADGSAFPVYASLSSPDMLTSGPNGSIFTDQGPQSSAEAGPPQVRQIAADGGVTIPWPNVTFTELNDVAYDSTNHRLFVVDSNGTTVRTIKILPVSP